MRMWMMWVIWLAVVKQDGLALRPFDLSWSMLSAMDDIELQACYERCKRLF